MKRYNAPELKIIALMAEDVLTESNDNYGVWNTNWEGLFS